MRSLLLAGLLVFGALPAEARTMHVMESSPHTETTMTGRLREFFVRFDGPVDHAASRLVVLRHGTAVATLRPRLNSNPSTLYAGVPSLAAGDYVLHWHAVSAGDREATEGDIPFTVR